MPQISNKLQIMLTNYIKKYPLSLLLTIVVVALSTLPIGAPEFAQDVPLADKWTHMIMYFGVALVVGWEYCYFGDSSTLPYWEACWNWYKNMAPPTAPVNGWTLLPIVLERQPVP